jgi:signal transduction histidine kinase
MQHFSIKFRLSLAFFLFLFLVVFLGVFSISCLNDFDGVADQIRNRWLPNTRFLGDINNYTSDFRAAEGTLLLASAPTDITAGTQEMDELDRNIAKAQHAYEKIYHNDKETVLYRRFSQDWIRYRTIVDHVLGLMHANKREDGIALYKTASRSAYNAASDTLGELTGLNVEEDEQASDRAVEAYRRVRFLTVIAMLLGVLMVTVGVLYIRRAISNPILALAESMHRLTDNDMDVSIHGTEQRDEIGEMARAVVVFRDNMVELALSRQGLIQQASMLEEKLEHERNLMAAQRNFITMTSHEFRTPLNIIDGHAQRLVKTKDALRPDDIAERAGKIRGAVKQMSDVIDNLTNATLLFEGQPELYFHPSNINLGTLVHEVCHQHREIVPSAHIIENISARPLEMNGDPKLLRQVLANLLSNAIKYSHEGGVIEISADGDSRHIVVAVQDHGIGIPAKDIDGIFGRYIRGSNVSDISGTGIGLYLARMVVEMHGGAITVHSAEGKGSVFTVRLPVTRL